MRYLHACYVPEMIDVTSPRTQIRVRSLVFASGFSGGSPAIRNFQLLEV